MDLQNLTQHRHLLPASSAFSKAASQQRSSSEPRDLWSQLWLWHYQFEVTFGPYVMDSGERAVFYIAFLSLLVATLLLKYWCCNAVGAIMGSAAARQWRMFVGQLTAKNVVGWSTGGVQLMHSSARNGVQQGFAENRTLFAP